MDKSNKLITNNKKLTEKSEKEVKKMLASLNRLSSVMGEGKKFTCSKCGEEKRIILAALDKNFKEICFCWDCGTPKVLEDFLGKEYLEKIIKEWENKLKRLEINSLSIAKYFYENWKVSDPVTMQRLIYFTYLEILDKENTIIFKEKFQAWPGGPVLESVIYPMYENCEDLKKFFSEIKELEEINIIQYLKKTAKKYLSLEPSRTYREARNKLWLDSLDDERDNNPINENNLFIFIQENRRQPLSLTR